MNLEVSDAERELLLEILEEKQKRMIQEIDHTDTHRFEDLLKQKLELLEAFKQRLADSKS